MELLNLRITLSDLARQQLDENEPFVDLGQELLFRILELCAQPATVNNVVDLCNTILSRYENLPDAIEGIKNKEVTLEQYAIN